MLAVFSGSVFPSGMPLADGFVKALAEPSSILD
jgi:hypothetical protein